MPLSALKERRLQVSFWVGIGLAALALIYLAKARSSWPWFSLWVFALLSIPVVLNLPPVRRALGLSWFKISLLTLTGVCLLNLFLFHVETHRQRSERLEVSGVYFDAQHDPIRVGVGWPNLDARLEGSLYEFDRWSLQLSRTEGDRFRIDGVHQVDMLRTRDRSWRNYMGRPTVPALGKALHGRSGIITHTPSDSDTVRLDLDRTGPRGTLRWGGASAPLSAEEGVPDRRLARRLRGGIPLAELDWDSVPDREMAEDLVLTQVSSGLALGRLRITLPRYRIVARSDGDGWSEEDLPELAAGDTLWVTSRGKTWAFAVDRVPGLSRVNAPVAVTYVRRPRVTGWALPSSEACGSDADRCAVLSSGPLPPPQPHFDLSGFGLDTARYSILARLEAEGDGVRIVGATEVVELAYGEVRPVPALPLVDSDPEAGILIRAERSAQGRQRDVLFTVLTLWLLVFGGLLVVSGDRRLWEAPHGSSPHLGTAWALLNVFLIFLGVRLALGLRVAYTPPFYDRAAATAVGIWITFAILLVALGRWSSWSPGFFHHVQRIWRPVSRLFVPGVNGRREAPPSTKFTLLKAEPGDPVEAILVRKARRRTFYGMVFFLPALGGLLWQRPTAAPSLLVAAVVLGAWLAMGVARRRGSHWPLSAHPLRVLTADAEAEKPSIAFGIAAGASVVTALAMHAPLVALAPVLLLLLLFGVSHLTGRGSWADQPRTRGGVVLAVLLLLALTGVMAFSSQPLAVGGAVLAAFGGLGLWLAGAPKGAKESRLASAHRWFAELGKAVLSGSGWVGVVLVLGVLGFLNTQEVPPFVRFALVFMLFLLAIRAGLACNRVLQQDRRRGYVEGFGLLVIPLGVLLVFMLFDFGLGLVFFVPMFATVLLSARMDRLPLPVLSGAVAVVAGLALAAGSVLRPSLTDLRLAPDVPSFAEEFRGVGNPVVDGLRAVGVGGPVTRATVRSMAASDPDLLEEALAFAGPSEALFAAAPSLEQVWGGRAYAASDWTGTGFAGTTLLGRGVPTAVSYAENAFSVYVLSEHGALGGIGVLLVYLALLAVVAIWVVRTHETIQESPHGLAVLAMTVGGALWLTLPAAYVAASNLAVVPLTGQNMPFLGLNSWADVVLSAGLATAVLFALASLDEAESQEASP